MLELPESLRSELKAPFGPIYTDTESLLEAATEPVVAVGDIVTYHLLEAGYTPAVALVDERTKREAVDSEVRDAVVGNNGTPAFEEQVSVRNPAAQVTEELLSTLCSAVRSGRTTLVLVDGEEDLATLPAILAVPAGASVVYGQPGEGMVLVTADGETRDRVGDILAQMDGDTQAALDLLSA